MGTPLAFGRVFFSSTSSRRLLWLLLALPLVLSGVSGRTLAASNVITSSGPLTRIEIGGDLNCGVNHAGDGSGEFYSDLACATLVAVDGILYRPSSIPAGNSAGPFTPFTPVSQQGVLGAGTSADPYRIVTIVDLGTTGLRITQTDSYVVGQEAYRTDI